jgi:hypothetical protein
MKRQASCANAITPRNPARNVHGPTPSVNAVAPTAPAPTVDVSSSPAVRPKGPNCGTSFNAPLDE